MSSLFELLKLFEGEQNIGYYYSARQDGTVR